MAYRPYSSDAYNPPSDVRRSNSPWHAHRSPRGYGGEYHSPYAQYNHNVGASHQYPSTGRTSGMSPPRGLSSSPANVGGGQYASPRTPQVQPPKTPQVSIFVDGDTVGVRRKTNHTAADLASSPSQATATSAAKQQPSPMAQKEREEQARQLGQLQRWLLESRQHEVAVHHAGRYVTPMEKWKRVIGKEYGTPRHAEVEGARSVENVKEPIRYSLRRAQVALASGGELHGSLLRSPSPRMGAPFQSPRPTGVPGPGSYTLPSQFASSQQR